MSRHSGIGPPALVDLPEIYSDFRDFATRKLQIDSGMLGVVLDDVSGSTGEDATMFCVPDVGDTDIVCVYGICVVLMCRGD